MAATASIVVALCSSEFTLFSFLEAMEGPLVPASHLGPAEGGIWEKLVSVRDRKLSCVPVAGLGGTLLGHGSLKGKASPLTLHTTSFFPCCLQDLFCTHFLCPWTLFLSFPRYIQCHGRSKARACSSRPFLRALVQELHLLIIRAHVCLSANKSHSPISHCLLCHGPMLVSFPGTEAGEPTSSGSPQARGTVGGV